MNEQHVCWYTPHLSRDRHLHFSYLLHANGIPHFLDDRAGCGHDWQCWREMFPLYLSLIHG